jgi:hypothetical protein
MLEGDRESPNLQGLSPSPGLRFFCSNNILQLECFLAAKLPPAVADNCKRKRNKK